MQKKRDEQRKLTTSNPTYSDYLSEGFNPLLCKGYHPKYNPKKDYKTAKEPVFSGWNNPDYVPPTLTEIEAWEKAGGWIGWRIPKGLIVPDVEDPEAISRVKESCGERSIEPGTHQTNHGLHFFFLTDRNLSASSKVFTKCGVEVTYRVGGKNYLILAPTNGRTWQCWKTPDDLPTLLDDFLPYDRRNVNDVVNCLSWQVRKAYREGHFSGYEDIDAAFMGFLIECILEEDQIRHVFKITFGPDYDERQTTLMYERTRTKIRDGDPVLGAGTFMLGVKEQQLDEVGRFARELQALTGTGRATVNDEWPDPVPFDEFSSLPDFPTDALSGIGREIVEVASQVNQVDPALTASLYLACLSSSCSRKTRVDLASHTESLNLYLCPVYDSGNRKSSTDSVMTKPLYEFQRNRQDEMKKIIQEAHNAFKIKEKRLERLQKKAAEVKDPMQMTELENQAKKLTLDLSDNPVPKSPIYLVDDVTPEKLGVLMADNGERMALITPEGGLFEIMAGRYSKDCIGNIDLFLKAHAGDYWSNQRIGREAKAMQAPALTLCLAVQSEVIEEAGKNNHFRGKGLLARFLYSRCKSQVGYRGRQKNSIPSSLSQSYRDHIFSLMEIPLTDTCLSLSGEAQEVWDEFYSDIEKEMRPEGSLCYLPDWGSKLAGAVARIAGLLHLAEHRANGLSLPISVNFVNASCVIGAYFKEHAIAVFGLMQEDRRFKLARQIVAYLVRAKVETIKGRDIMHHTSIKVMEEVEQGLKVLIDRGYIREEAGALNNPGPGRPSGKTYRVNPKIFEGKNV